MVAGDDDDWLSHFGGRLADVRHGRVYWLAIHLLILGFVGVLWALPVPHEFYTISPLLNWGSALLMVTAVYYFIISLPLAIGMLPILLALAAFQFWLSSSGFPALALTVAATVSGIVGLMLERGAVTKVVNDLLLAMLAPAYLLSLLYRKLGIPI